MAASRPVSIFCGPSSVPPGVISESPGSVIGSAPCAPALDLLVAPNNTLGIAHPANFIANESAVRQSASEYERPVTQDELMAQLNSRIRQLEQENLELKNCHAQWLQGDMVLVGSEEWDRTKMRLVVRTAEVAQLQRKVDVMNEDASRLKKDAEAAKHQKARYVQQRFHYRALIKHLKSQISKMDDPFGEDKLCDDERVPGEGGDHAALLEVLDVCQFSKILVKDLRPRMARLLLPKCYPAYMMLAAFRHFDHAKDESSLTGLFSTVHAMLKDRISNSSDLDILSLWLVNTWRLMNLLRQYSGETENEWNAQNSEKQNVQRMQSVDVAAIRELLRARVEECYQSLMKKAIEPVLTPKIVPAVLQQESSHDMEARSNLTTLDSKDSKRRGLEDLTDFLNFIYAKLSVYGADPVLLSQVFRQIIQWVCSIALNHVVYRKELCTFKTAIQIEHNIIDLQRWLASKSLGEHRDGLEPLLQACHLLQSTKDKSNLDTICGDMTSRLMPHQVAAILQHYTPSHDSEERPVEQELLILVQRKLNERDAAAGKLDEAKMDMAMICGFLHPFDTEPFVYSDFQLETMTLPACLSLGQVSRLI